MCSNSNECDNSLGLICPATTLLCNCPSNSSSIFCDCQRTPGNEFYWDGNTCQTALTQGQPCIDSSTSYLCQTLTQLTSCNDSTGSFLCECGYLQYYDSVTMMCKNQGTINTTCSANYQCLSIYGLTCINNLCRCFYFSFQMCTH